MIKVLVLLPLFSLVCSCGNNHKYIDNYVGVYQVTTGYEKQMHYYWGSKTEKSSKELPGLLSIVTINKNGEVIFRDKGGYETKGDINTSKDNCNFTGLCIDSSYKFKVVNDSEGRKTLDYSYTQDKHLVEYDYITRRYILTEYFDPYDFKNVIGTYKIDTSTYRKNWYHDGTHQTVSKSDNYNFLVKGTLVIDENKNVVVTNTSGVSQSGTLSMDKATIYFNLNDENPLIRKDMKFIFSTSLATFTMYGNLEVRDSESLTNYNIESFCVSLSKVK